MPPRVTIRDIADELGLSTATVSNVIHGKTARVSDETARRVQSLLEQRDYIPSMAGVLLARNDSKIIGVFVNDHEKYEGHTLDDAFIASSLNHLSAQIEANGLFMMVKTAKTAAQILQFASMWNMDGLIVLGFCQQDYAWLRAHMRIPFVVYDGLCQTPERFANLTLDNFGGGRQIGAYLRTLGHRRALCLADNDTGVDQARMAGFRAGFAPGEVQTLLVPMQREARRTVYRTQLARFRGVTAVFAVSDYYAIELMHALTEQGLRIPDELSVAGFDDIPLCALVNPTLTTIRQDGARRARLAMQTLLALRAGRPAQTAHILPVELVIRASTCPPLH